MNGADIRSLRDGGSVQALDGLRGLAVILVLVHNLRSPWTRQLQELPLHVLGFVGWIGVDLFFVLSGLLITSILLRTKGADGYFSTFYARRALRIFPLYYLALALLALLPNVFVQLQDVDACRQTQPWDWLYLSNVRSALEGEWGPCRTNHFWSLAVEEQFYLLWPLVVFALPRERLGTVIGGAIAVSVALRAALSWMGAPPVALYALTPLRMDGLLLGAWLALRIYQGRMGASERRMAAWAIVVIPAALAPIFALAASRLGGYTLSNLGSTMQQFGYVGLAAFWTAVVVLLLGSGKGGVRTFFESRFLRLAGKHSYALYIVHPLVKGALEGWVLGLGFEGAAFQIAQLVIYGGVSIACAVAVWYAWELPFLRLKRAFPYRTSSESGGHRAALG